MKVEPAVLAAAIDLGRMRPRDELIAAGKEWQRWRIWSSPWYLRWRRLLWWRRPQSPKLSMAEHVFFQAFDDAPILRHLRTALYESPKGISVQESILFPPRH